MGFLPLTNYAGYEHILGAAPCFVHPGNGTIYGCANEKLGGVRQNLSIYRFRRGATAPELVKRYMGSVDSQAQITMGGCVIDQEGALVVWTSLIPPGSAGVTKTGFQGVWDRIPGVDDPWTLTPGTPAPGGGITLAPAPLTSALWSGRVVGGGEAVNIPMTFGAPLASAYLLRLVVSGGAPDIRARAGSEAAPSFFTVNTQVAGVQVHSQGWAPGPVVYISTVNGPAQVWLQVVGWSAG